MDINKLYLQLHSCQKKDLLAMNKYFIPNQSGGDSFTKVELVNNLLFNNNYTMNGGALLRYADTGKSRGDSVRSSIKDMRVTLTEQKRQLKGMKSGSQKQELQSTHDSTIEEFNKLKQQLSSHTKETRRTARKHKRTQYRTRQKSINKDEIKYRFIGSLFRLILHPSLNIQIYGWILSNCIIKDNDTYCKGFLIIHTESDITTRCPMWCSDIYFGIFKENDDGTFESLLEKGNYQQIISPKFRNFIVQPDVPKTRTIDINTSSGQLPGDAVNVYNEIWKGRRAPLLKRYLPRLQDEVYYSSIQVYDRDMNKQHGFDENAVDLSDIHNFTIYVTPKTTCSSLGTNQMPFYQKKVPAYFTREFKFFNMFCRDYFPN